MSRYRDDFLIGFSHPKARYFLLLRLGNCSCIALPPASVQSKRKYPKKRRPGCRFFLRSSVLSRVGRVGSCLYALWVHLPTRGIPAVPLYALWVFGLIPTKSAVLGAANGRKATLLRNVSKLGSKNGGQKKGG
ncbi:hypothetical protein [Methylovulum psychrotolerans]|uniref:hypothetical protein n=1 Tax=Methylovulum psychrotolerans TaxID=1704499 RepID=UPI0014752815|nr:hypothetical protein [Methylovulum psychrotolerans]